MARLHRNHDDHAVETGGGRRVAAQRQGASIRLAMGTATKPAERGKYLEMGITTASQCLW
jgi:hypothetical protein